MQDSLGNTVTAGSVDALRLIDTAIDLHVRAWPRALDAAEEATDADPEMALGHALQIHATCGRRLLAESCMSRARGGARRVSAREGSLLELLEYITRGRTHAGRA